jgi:hypothetical protein
MNSVLVCRYVAPQVVYAILATARVDRLAGGNFDGYPARLSNTERKWAHGRDMEALAA